MARYWYGWIDSGTGGVPFYGAVDADNITRTNNTVTIHNLRAMERAGNGEGGSVWYSYTWYADLEIPRYQLRINGGVTKGNTGTANIKNIEYSVGGGSPSFTVGVNQTTIDLAFRYRDSAPYTGGWITPGAVISIPGVGSPALNSQSSSAIKIKTATINYATTPGTNATTSSVKLQYGTTTSYGTEMSSGSASGSFNLTNLKPGKTYNYRFVITNGAGRVTTSGNYTFKTKAVSASLPMIAAVGM